MASAAYFAWIKDGSPYEDAVWLADEKKIWQEYGFTFWTKGNDEHMRAEPPQDHTPISQTGWPIKSAYGIGHAFDVPNPPSSLPPLWKIAEQIIADKNAKVAGTEWIKYLNYTDRDGKCWHISWQPTYSKTSSTDRDHLHVSGRSDMDKTHTSYDPIARLENSMATDVALTPKQDQKLSAIDMRLRPFVTGNAGPYDVTWTDDLTDQEVMWAVVQLHKIDDLLTQVAELKTAIAAIHELLVNPPAVSVIVDKAMMEEAVVSAIQAHPLAPK